ncbi:MAG: ATP-binding protein, partial [Bacteroidetes bacterium CG02_land_8_20_14_3_00_31_25]
MEKEKLKKIIIENQQFINDLQIVDREISIEYAANYVFTGPRRAGKTYLMYQVAKDLVAKSILTPEQILFIGFEDERLMELKAKELDE